MWAPLLAVVLTGALLAADRIDARQLVERAANEKELRDAVAQIASSGVDLGADLRLAETLCTAWERVGRPDEGRALIEGLKGRVEERFESRRLTFLSQHLQRTGHVDDAVAAAREALAFARATPDRRGMEDSEHRALERLAQALEAQGSHREALATYEEWHPSSFCGTCSGEMAAERVIAIARCHAALGEVDEALDGLLRFVAEGHRGGLADVRGAARAACATAGRHDRMTALRARLADDALEPARAAVEPFLKLGDALASRDAGTLLRQAAEWKDDSKALEIVGAAYGELGEDAIADLCRRIVKGDRMALSIASSGRIRAARRAVLSRAALDPGFAPTLQRIARELE